MNVAVSILERRVAPTHLNPMTMGLFASTNPHSLLSELRSFVALTTDEAANRWPVYKCDRGEA
jgi:hypothetical protein